MHVYTKTKNYAVYTYDTNNTTAITGTDDTYDTCDTRSKRYTADMILAPSWCTDKTLVAMQRLSAYFEGLSTEAKTRYKHKISYIDGLDPFVASSVGVCPYNMEDTWLRDNQKLYRCWFCCVVVALSCWSDTGSE